MTETESEQVAVVPVAEEETRGGAGSGSGPDGVEGTPPTAATVDIPRQQSSAEAADGRTGEDAGA
ncbi:hypothetical protein [Streptomyces sp. NPDC059247]|uniref:hypothetical protein n=1 Tax=Streptomyces sp. NPDC059247 TaxID=3346790 RepID=UPI0036929C3B